MDIDQAKKSITAWASCLNFRIRIYLYGSYLKNTYRPDSDLDLAFEFLDPWIDALLEWFDHHPQWEKDLSMAVGIPVHLELYDEQNENLCSYLNESSAIIFESPVAPEDDGDTPQSFEILWDKE